MRIRVEQVEQQMAAAEGKTLVSVERELYTEQRVLWMKEQKPLQAPDNNIEIGVLDAIEKGL